MKFKRFLATLTAYSILIQSTPVLAGGYTTVDDGQLETENEGVSRAIRVTAKSKADFTVALPTQINIETNEDSKNYLKGKYSFGIKGRLDRNTKVIIAPEDEDKSVEGNNFYLVDSQHLSDDKILVTVKDHQTVFDNKDLEGYSDNMKTIDCEVQASDDFYPGDWEADLVYTVKVEHIR